MLLDTRPVEQERTQEREVTWGYLCGAYTISVHLSLRTPEAHSHLSSVESVLALGVHVKGEVVTPCPSGEEALSVLCCVVLPPPA